MSAVDLPSGITLQNIEGTEFSRLPSEVGLDFAPIVQKYPLTTVVTIFFLTFFGLLNIFHLTITGITLGVTSLAVGATIAKGISSSPWDFADALSRSLYEVKSMFMTSRPPAATPPTKE